MRTDRRVTVSMIARPRAIRPTTWAVYTGAPYETVEAPATGSAFCRPACERITCPVLGVADGVIAGNSPAALPAPMSRLASAFRFGMGPSASVGRCVALGEALADEAAPVTDVVAVAAGGVHLTVVATLAVAVSFSELTEDAFDATAIRAFRVTGALTELTVQEALKSPVVQPLVNSGFSVDGWAASATDTFEAEPSLVETCTV